MFVYFPVLYVNPLKIDFFSFLLRYACKLAAKKPAETEIPKIVSANVDCSSSVLTRKYFLTGCK